MSSVEQKQLGAGPHGLRPRYSSPTMSLRVEMPRSLGCGPRRLGRSSYLLDILFSNAYDGCTLMLLTPMPRTSPAADADADVKSPLNRFLLLVLVVLVAAVFLLVGLSSLLSCWEKRRVDADGDGDCNWCWLNAFTCVFVVNAAQLGMRHDSIK